MSQAINILTLSGQRLDVYPSESIEVNMGGISLLSLKDRTTSYSNSFTLPRTPNNEQILQFASQPTRKNRPELSVIIQKGLFSQKAMLKITSFESDYKATITYDSDNTIKSLSDLNVYSLPYVESKGTVASTTAWTPNSPDDNLFINAFQLVENNKKYFFPIGYLHTVNLDSTIRGGAFISVASIISILSDTYGYTFNGTLFSDSLYTRLSVHNPFVYAEIGTPSIDGFGLYVHPVSFKRATVTSEWSVADFLKKLAYLFLSNVVISGKTITLNKLNLSVNPVAIETLSFDKELYSGYKRVNYINYDIKDENVFENFAGDFFNAEGKDIGEALSIGLGIPEFFGGTYSGYDFNGKDYPIIMSYAASSSAFQSKLSASTNYVSTNGRSIAPLSLSPIYKNLLNPIFANPVILNAQGYIDHLTANTIMNNRVINSIKLGGRYWVDEMKYNLTTGNSVLKLIKL